MLGWLGVRVEDLFVVEVGFRMGLGLNPRFAPSSFCGGPMWSRLGLGRGYG